MSGFHWQDDLNSIDNFINRFCKRSHPSSPVWIYFITALVGSGWRSEEAARCQLAPRTGLWWGEGGCLGQTGWKSLSVCVQTCVCVWWTEGKSGGYWETICATSRFSPGASAACLCNSNKWTDVGLCVCLLRRKTLLEPSPLSSGDAIETRNSLCFKCMRSLLFRIILLSS